MENSLNSSYEKRKEDRESKSTQHSEIGIETETNEIANIRVVREVLHTLNSGDTSNVQ